MTAQEKNRTSDSLLSGLVSELSAHPIAGTMKHHVAHGAVSVFDHAVSVAKLSDKINDRLRLHADRRALLRGALLHDYYLYDWHDCPDRSILHLHGFYHPKVALENARRDFTLSDKEENIIRSHMWPLTIFHLPRCREAAIVCAADKICSLHETILRRPLS